MCSVWQYTNKASLWCRGQICMAQDATHDPEPIMLEEAAARKDPTLQAILRSELGLEAYDSAQLARQGFCQHTTNAVCHAPPGLRCATLHHRSFCMTRSIRWRCLASPACGPAAMAWQ